MKKIIMLILIFQLPGVIHCNNIGDQVKDIDDTYGELIFIQDKYYNEDTGLYEVTDYPIETERNSDEDPELETSKTNIYLKVTADKIIMYLQLTVLDDDGTILSDEIKYCSSSDQLISSSLFDEYEISDNDASGNEIMTIYMPDDPNEYIKMMKENIPDGAIDVCNSDSKKKYTEPNKINTYILPLLFKSAFQNIFFPFKSAGIIIFNFSLEATVCINH